jgi:hypothetical protein
LICYFFYRFSACMHGNMINIARTRTFPYGQYTLNKLGSSS